jgi:hypothetical protein
MNQMFPWVEGAEKGAEMGHRPLNTMTHVEILVAMLTLVSILEIQHTYRLAPLKPKICTFLSSKDGPFFVFTYTRLAKSSNIQNVSWDTLYKNVHFCPDLPSPYLSTSEHLG